MSEFVRLRQHITIAKGKPPAELPFDGPGASPYLTPEYLRGRAAAQPAKPGVDAVAVADGDAVLLWDGSNAGEFFPGRAGLAASTMARIRADESFHRGYLVHALKHLEPRLKSQTNGTGIPHVDREVLEGFQVFRPAALEQTRIAQVLDTLDTTIRQTQAVIEKVKKVKQGLLHDLLTRGIDANGELRPPQSQAPHLYKDSPLGWIPREWEARTVGDSCDLHNGLRLPLASDVRKKMPGPFPYFGPTGILDFIDEFRVEGTFVLISEDGDHFLKFASRPMTQLVSGRFNVNNHAHLLTGRLCRTEWVDLWFRHRDITLFLTRQGAGRFKLNKESLQSLPLATPTDREQGAILDMLASMEARIAAEARVHDKLRAQKSGLTDDLLTARVRVTPLLA
jgi:type I restriction enzyme S subunit